MPNYVKNFVILQLLLVPFIWGYDTACDKSTIAVGGPNLF